MDGGFGYNNPVLQLITESRLCFGPARQVCCLVSIGTGGNPDIAFPKGVTWLFKPTSVKNNLRLLSLPTSSSSQHYEAGLLCGPGAYHRFDMGELVSEQDWDVKAYGGQVAFHLDDHEKLGQPIVSLTEEYLRYGEAKVEACSARLLSDVL